MWGALDRSKGGGTGRTVNSLKDHLRGGLTIKKFLILSIALGLAGFKLSCNRVQKNQVFAFFFIFDLT